MSKTEIKTFSGSVVTVLLLPTVYEIAASIGHKQIKHDVVQMLFWLKYERTSTSLLWQLNMKQGYTDTAAWYLNVGSTLLYNLITQALAAGKLTYYERMCGLL